MNPRTSYARTSAETASPSRRLVMLLDAALRHVRTGAVALEQGRAADAHVPLHKANDIVVELLATLDVARAPELAENLGSVYTFICDRLTRGALMNDPTLVREAERVFLPVVEAFHEAVDSLAGDPSSATTP